MLDEQSVKTIWENKIKTTFEEYLSIPNVSPAYSSTWEQDGHMEKAILLFEKWAREHAPKNSTIFIQRIEGKTPLLLIDVPALEKTGNDTILLYGHLDKQPEMLGWRDDINPWGAFYEEDRLYGRGSADDGYAMFSAIMVANDLEDSKTPHPRLLIVIEASEESGSPDLPLHLEKLDESLRENKCKHIGDVALVVCLDSGALTYEHLWITNSLRGLIEIRLTIRSLDSGTHSGAAGGIVPSTTNILRTLLDRISKAPSGEIILDDLNIEIPDHIRLAAENVAEILGSTDAHGLPFAKGVEPLVQSVADQLIANTYKPALEIIGIDGIPSTADAGNVLLPYINVSLSFRIPPGVVPEIAVGSITQELNHDTPYNAQVTVAVESLASGWAAPERAKWLSEAIESASQKHFGKPVQFMGEGGTIPFMHMLGEKYPKAGFMVTGLLGPGSNAHGPNEFLHLPTFFKLTACVSDVISKFK